VSVDPRTQGDARTKTGLYWYWVRRRREVSAVDWVKVAEPTTDQALLRGSAAAHSSHGVLERRKCGPNHLLHFPAIQPGMENPHRFPIYTSSLTSPANLTDCECASPPARSWTQPSCTRPRRPRTESSCYRGLKKNAHQLFVICGLVDLFLSRQKLLDSERVDESRFDGRRRRQEIQVES
jgi:hypothetical protein